MKLSSPFGEVHLHSESLQLKKEILCLYVVFHNVQYFHIYDLISLWVREVDISYQFAK